MNCGLESETASNVTRNHIVGSRLKFFSLQRRHSTEPLQFSHLILDLKRRPLYATFLKWLLFLKTTTSVAKTSSTGSAERYLKEIQIVCLMHLASDAIDLSALELPDSHWPPP